ncbi:hypothetical protein HY230_09285 [Candidatus Acetothermia bacterium]|nr:hypothetical protein [Candidatus Acetothermia bacterium]
MYSTKLAVRFLLVSFLVGASAWGLKIPGDITQVASCPLAKEQQATAVDQMRSSDLAFAAVEQKVGVTPIRANFRAPDIPINIKLLVNAPVSRAAGIALDAAGNQLFFVQPNRGTLTRLSLFEPELEFGLPGQPLERPVLPAIATGLDKPQDVVLDLVNQVAYISEGGGKIKRVNLTPPFPKTVGNGIVDILSGASGSELLNEPRQIALDQENKRLYVVQNGSSQLTVIDISVIPGKRTDISVSGTPGHAFRQPTGLVLSKDHQFAYVSEEPFEGALGVVPRISRINLITGSRELITASNIDPRPTFSYLAWADDAQTALYVGIRSPVDELQRVDLTTTPPKRTTVTKIEPTMFHPSPLGIAVDVHAGIPIYMTTDQAVLKLDQQLPEVNPKNGKSLVFTGVGLVPYVAIDDEGYADTVTILPTYSFIQVDDAPFGGTLNIFGNAKFLHADKKVRFYKVLAKREGDPGPSVPLTPTWTRVRQLGFGQSEIIEFKPDSQGRYRLDPSEDLYPLDLLMVWPTTENGKWTLTLEVERDGFPDLDDPFGKVKSTAIDLPNNKLTLRIDNTPPVAEIRLIKQGPTGGTTIDACGIAIGSVASGADKFRLQIIASDDDGLGKGHLRDWSLADKWGENKPRPIDSDEYANHVSSDRSWKGLFVPTDKPDSPYQVSPTDNGQRCAHLIELVVYSRTTNGYDQRQFVTYFKTFTTMLTP